MTCFRPSPILHSTRNLYIHLFTCALINANIVSLATENVTVTDNVTKQMTVHFVNITTYDSPTTQNAGISSTQTTNTTIGRVSTIENYTSKTATVKGRETTNTYSSLTDSWKTQTQAASETTGGSSNSSPNDTLTSPPTHSSTDSLSGGSTQVTAETYDQSTSIVYNDTSHSVTNSTTPSTIIHNEDTTSLQAGNKTISTAISTQNFAPRTTEQYKVSILSEKMHIVIQVAVPAGILLIIFLVIIGFVYSTIKREKEKSYGLPKKTEMTTKFSRDSYFRQSYIVNPSFAYDEPFDESEYNFSSLFSGNSELQRDHKIVMDISKKWTF